MCSILKTNGDKRGIVVLSKKKKVPSKGVITGVAVNVKVDQLKGKIPGVCDARRLVQRRQGGEFLPDKVMLGFGFCAEYITLLQVSSLWARGV